MFPPFLHLEDIFIPLEIEWRGQKRPVEVRIEQLPTEPVQAVPVCSFADAPEYGEWLLVSGPYDIYTLGNPYNLLQVRPVSQGMSLEKGKRVQLNSQRVEKLRTTIERAVNAVLGGIRVIRIATLPFLPHSPQVVVVSGRGGLWLDAWKSPNTTRFATPNFNLYEDGVQLQQWVQARWETLDSDVRFAWEWANWTEEERLMRSCGWENLRQQEMDKVMTWVLTCRNDLWPHDHGWSWQLNAGEKRGKLLNVIYWDDQNNIYQNSRETLEQWQKWLWSHFCPHWRNDWIAEHPCVEEFWENRPLCSVDRVESPTMHEQLEARLRLRDWLKEKTTSDQANRLMSYLS